MNSGALGTLETGGERLVARRTIEKSRFHVRRVSVNYAVQLSMTHRPC